MGQKLVSIKFDAGSSPNLWNLRYSPEFRLEISSGSNWQLVENYYPRITGTPVTYPVNVAETKTLTNSVIRDSIKNNKRIAFLVEDEIKNWRITMQDTFLTEGSVEILSSGSFVGEN